MSEGLSDRPGHDRGETLLVDDLYAAVYELRGSLTVLLSRVGNEAHRPQELSRSLGLDKNLARKISRIVQSTDAGEVVQHLPGNTGFNMLLSAVERLGATSDELSRARAAMRAMEGMVERHVGDKPTLELILDNLPTTSRDRLLVSRKLSFRGDSGIWGVQARTRLNTAIIAPTASQPDMITSAAIGGWVDFRRLRSEARWAMFRRRGYGAARVTRDMPIDPNESPESAMLLRQFCSPKMPPIHKVIDPNGDIVFELGASPVGNTGAFNCFSAWYQDAIGSRYADEENSIGEFGAVISAPVENLVFDLIVHRSLNYATNTSVKVFGSLAPHKHLTDRDVLPLDVRPMSLGSYPPVVDTPLVPKYGEVVDTVMKACNWSRKDFTGVRYVVEYPPYPSTVVISFPLERKG
jgi:hypothetical protein